MTTQSRLDFDILKVAQSLLPDQLLTRIVPPVRLASDTNLFRFGNDDGDHLHLIVDGCGTFTAVFHPDSVLQHTEEHHLNDFPDAGERVTVH